MHVPFASSHTMVFANTSG